MMQKFSLLASLLLIAAPVSAAAQEWRHAPELPIMLSNFKFEPSSIRLKAGQPVRLHLVNRSPGEHDFAAKEFFAAAKIRPRDAAAVAQGRVAVEQNATRDVTLVPAAGRYRFRCSNILHRLLGMSGEIVVD